MTVPQITAPPDPSTYRAVLGQYPTGVTAITSTGSAGGPLAMIVGSFGSVSLDPPLVSYMAARTSSSFAEIRQQRTFCANVLASDQEAVCRQLSIKGQRDKLANLSWHPSPHGNPVLDGVLAWVECRVADQIAAGDHVIVLGEVVGLEAIRSARPLLFLGGGYGRFSAHSRVMGPAPDVMRQLHVADLARRPMEDLCQELQMECALVAPVEDVLVRVASALPTDTDIRPARVGVRLPFEAPMGAAFVAWSDPEARRRWMRRGAVELSESQQAAHLAALARIRARGWTVTLADARFRDLDARMVRLDAGERAPMPSSDGADHEVYDPPLDATGPFRVRNLSVPVLDPEGAVIMYLSMSADSRPMSAAEIAAAGERGRAASARITSAVAGSGSA